MTSSSKDNKNSHKLCSSGNSLYATIDYEEVFKITLFKWTDLGINKNLLYEISQSSLLHQQTTLMEAQFTMMTRLDVVYAPIHYICSKVCDDAALQ